VRYLILSDIHGNWEALEAVLNAAREDGYEHVLALLWRRRGLRRRSQCG
jgi:hypothetical protein